MRIKTIDDFDLRDKVVILRVDINSSVVGKGVLMSERIRQASKTISELKRRKSKVVVIAHQANPGEKGFVSLKGHAELLNRFVKIKFVDDIIGKKAIREIRSLKSGNAILLENIRFLNDEFHPGKNRIIKTLVPVLDVYINDAFSVSHRNHTSVVSFPKYLPSGIGRLMQRELGALENIKIKNCLYLLGGAKPQENIKLLNGRKVLTYGLFGQLCIISKGKDLGAQNKFLEKQLFMIGRLKRKLRNVQTPVDFAVNKNGKREELQIEDFPSRYEIFDIGEKTVESYVAEIKKARAVYMKGPAGYCEDNRFCKGTFAILKAVSKCKGFTLVGGGQLSNAIEKSKIDPKKFDYVSLSGGALLRYISGEKLPGVEVLKRYSRPVKSLF